MLCNLLFETMCYHRDGHWPWRDRVRLRVGSNSCAQRICIEQSTSIA